MGRILRAAGTSIALGSAVAVAVNRRRRSRAADRSLSNPVALGGRGGRNGEIAKTAGKIGVSYGIHQGKRTFASAARREALDSEFMLKNAEEVTEVLGNLKGVMMKLGQMASYLDVGLPEPVREALSQLQAGAPPMAPELATTTLESALGRRVEDCFADWDANAIASASIGQVHRALTRDERAVAVKVQYPGIAQAIAADLDNTDILFTALGFLFPSLETAPLVTELRERLSEELDYANEATNQRLFADYYRDHPFIVVPEVVDDLSTPTVLTSDLLVGRRFSDLTGSTPAERNAVAEAIFRFVMRSLYCLGTFNGDPHPGNYLILDGGRVAFIDFGLVKHFTASEVELFAEMHRAMAIERDPVAFRSLLVTAGIIDDSAGISTARLHEFFEGFYEHFLGEGPTPITSDFASGLVSRMFDTDGPFADVQRILNVPPSFLLIQRINLGLYSIFAELEAVADWAAIFGDIVPWIASAPVTPMGRAEASWLATHPHASGKRI